MFKLKSLMELARGPAYELKEPRGCVGPTEVACGTHQSGGSGLVQQLHKGAAPLQVCLGGCRAHTKNGKNKMTIGPQRLAGGLQFVKVSSLES